MISNGPILYPKFISEEERILLKNHALHLLEINIIRPNVFGQNRFLVNYFSVDELTNTHLKIFQRIIKMLKLNNSQIDPLLGIVISVIKPGGFIHNHTDKYQEHDKFKHLSNKKNIRFNIMVNRDEDVSYNPHIESCVFEVKNCDAWCFAASELEHYTPKLVGQEFRIVYQFGFCLD